MRAVLVVFGTLLALAACTPPGGGAVDVAGCFTQAHTDWAAGADLTLAISATASGPNCANAVATFVVRTRDGEVLVAEAYPVSAVMGLSEKENPRDLQAALSDWIAISPASVKTSADLPAWAPHADVPVSGEFPFYPDDGVDRTSYEALRAARTPVLCYVQGMESQVCWAFRHGVAQRIGVQTFPG